MVIIRKSEDNLPTVCHERTKGFYTPKCGAAQEMRQQPEIANALYMKWKTPDETGGNG